MPSSSKKSSFVEKTTMEAATAKEAKDLWRKVLVETRDLCTDVWIIRHEPRVNMDEKLDKLGLRCELLRALTETVWEERRDQHAMLRKTLNNHTHHKNKKLWKQDRLKNIDMKMERMLARDRPFPAFLRPPPQQKPAAAMYPWQVGVDKFTSPPHWKEAGVSPNVILSRAKYDALMMAVPPKDAKLNAASVSPVPVASPVVPVRPKVSDIHEPEEVSIALSRRAGEEASLCILTDGTLDLARLHAALAAGTKRYCKLLLSRLPHRMLVRMKEEKESVEYSKLLKHRDFSLDSLLLGDVLNSAMLAQVGRCRQAWLRRPVPGQHDGVSTAAVSAEMRGGIVPLFSTMSGMAVPIHTRDLDSDEAKHPKVSAQSWRGGKLRLVPNLATFRTLLSMFTGKLLNGFPWGCEGNVVLGGSAVTACLTISDEEHWKWGSRLQELVSLQSTGVARATLVKALKNGLGSFQMANNILEFAIDEKEAHGALAEFTEKLFHNKSGTALHNSSDIDIFFIAPTKEAAAKTLSVVQSRLVSAIKQATAAERVSTSGKDGLQDEAPDFTTVRTPNSITLCPHFPFRQIQLVLKVAEDLGELATDVDLDCTAVFYDGRNVLAAPQAVHALQTGYNMVANKLILQRSQETTNRIAKYSQRGFGSIVYELCRHDPRCDVKVDSAILGRLASAERMARNPPRSFAQERGPEDDDETILKVLHGGYDKLFLPRGPHITPAILKKLLILQEQEDSVVSNIELVPWAEIVQWRREAHRRDVWNGDEGKAAEANSSHLSCYECGCQFTPPEPEVLGSTATTESSTAEHARTDRPPPPATHVRISKRRQNRSDSKLATGADNNKTQPRLRTVPVCTGCRSLDAKYRARLEDLTGYLAVVTGGRCKVGYEVCLKLLRCGASVVTSTRFPRCAARRFLEEHDSASWSDRLHIYGVDFTHFGLLNAFIDHLSNYYDVDILVNNAAQTVRRPPAYYAPLFAEEKALCAVDNFEEDSLAARVSLLVRTLGENPHAAPPNMNSTKILGVVALGPNADSVSRFEFEDQGASADLARSVPHDLISASVAMVPRLQGDDLDVTSEEGGKLFPLSRQDLHGEPLDLRSSTSWTSTLVTSGDGGGVASRELLEVLAVNAAAPFLLFQGVLPSMRRSGGGRYGRFVVNVSSAEGIFSTEGSAAKTSEHPHTNMAKAALNMLTKTSAAELASHNIFCTAVDPGWISMMRPGDPEAAARPLPPLSEADGAARVLAPVLDGILAVREGRSPLSGVLLRNFRVSTW